MLDFHRFVGLTSAEGNMRSFLEALEGEKMIPDYLPLALAASLPNWIRNIAKLFVPKRIKHILGCASKSATPPFNDSIYRVCFPLAKIANKPF